ncbi:hypothetical protein Tco_1204903 [Tanacetum coccineum]
MATLEFCDKHNMVAYLVKSEGSEGFHEIIGFLTSSHIYYALTECPTLYISFIEQFWQIAALSTIEDGVYAITTTIDGRDKIITKASIRRHLKLQDSKGLTSLPNAEIFEQLTHMGLKKSAVVTMVTTADANDQEGKTKLQATKGRYDNAQMFDTNVFNGEEMFVVEQSEKVVEEVVSTAKVSAAAIITTEEITLAQALAQLRSVKPKVVVQEPIKSITTTAPSTIPKAKSITFRYPGESTTRATLTSIPLNIKDKGKAKIIKPKRPLKMKEQIRLDEELAFNLQAEEEK